MTRGEGCGRAGAGTGPAAPLPVPTTEPVTCRRRGGVFGRGAEAGTVCPYCGGPLEPLRDAGAPGGEAA